MKHKSLNAKYIGQQLSPSISEEEAQETIDKLIRLGLLEKKNYQLIQVDELISTGDEVFNSLAISQHHKEMLNLAASSLDNTQENLRDISGVTIAISSRGIDELKLMIKKFRKEVLQLSEREKEKESIYQVSIQMFPLTKVDNV